MVAGQDNPDRPPDTGEWMHIYPPPPHSRVITLFHHGAHVRPWLLNYLGPLLEKLVSAHTLVVITDEEVAKPYLPTIIESLQNWNPGARTLSRAIPSGERHKTRDTWAALTDWMLAERCGRDTAVVALGGGVVGDVAGFVAATFMRGVPFVQCPTSLLAMVDASVGGKVGVDTPAGKNLVGAFHQPTAVFVDPTVLRTLPPSHRRAGLAEVLKHGIVADAAYLDQAVAIGPGLVDGTTIEWDGAELVDLIARSIEIKAEVVKQDEREAGIRQILNFGHTIGHAIEAESDYTLLHGDAISTGMVLESTLAERIGIAEPGTSAAVVRALAAVGLPTTLPDGMSPDALVERMRADKKARAGRFMLALPRRVGEMATDAGGYGITVDETDLRAVL